MPLEAARDRTRRDKCMFVIGSHDMIHAGAQLGSRGGERALPTHVARCAHASAALKRRGRARCKGVTAASMLLNSPGMIRQCRCMMHIRDVLNARASIERLSLRAPTSKSNMARDKTSYHRARALWERASPGPSRSNQSKRSSPTSWPQAHRHNKSDRDDGMRTLALAMRAVPTAAAQSRAQSGSI